MRSLFGPWLADISANFLVIVIVVLLILSKDQPFASDEPETFLITPRVVNPIGGSDAVELLRLRLISDPEVLWIDIAKTGVARNGTNGEEAIVFVLDHKGYQSTVDGLLSAGVSWTEFTPPAALKNSVGGWSPTFLSLSVVAEDPDQFRSALVDLLNNATTETLSGLGGQDSASAAQSWSEKWFRWLQITKDLATSVLLLFVAVVLVSIRRWASRA